MRERERKRERERERERENRYEQKQIRYYILSITTKLIIMSNNIL